MRRLLPHPLLSAILLVIWLLLVNELSVGHLLLGAVLGWAAGKPRLRRNKFVLGDAFADPSLLDRLYVLVASVRRRLPGVTPFCVEQPEACEPRDVA